MELLSDMEDLFLTFWQISIMFFLEEKQARRTIGYYLTVKKKRIIEQESIMLGDTEKGKYQVISLICTIRDKTRK